MNRLLLIALLLSATSALAQIPYFASNVGDGKLYGYSSLKVRPGINHQETYTTFQYGIGPHFATGIDLYTGPNCSYWGSLLRYGTSFGRRFNVGAEVTPSFALNDSFRFAYLTSALYLNGDISNDGHLFWCTNTWWGVYDNQAFTLSNYEYLGYTIDLNHHRSITPITGVIHSWKFDQDADIAAGAYNSFSHWNLYLWANYLLESHPRIIIGLDFAL